VSARRRGQAGETQRSRRIPQGGEGRSVDRRRRRRVGLREGGSGVRSAGRGGRCAEGLSWRSCTLSKSTIDFLFFSCGMRLK
jgi:hypothetical protein